jgi:hypothetical protein
LLKLCTSATKTTAAERAANTRESREWLRGYVVLERRNRVDRTHRRLPTLYTPLSLCGQWHNWYILSLVLPFPHVSDQVEVVSRNTAFGLVAKNAERSLLHLLPVLYSTVLYHIELLLRVLARVLAVLRMFRRGCGSLNNQTAC